MASIKCVITDDEPMARKGLVGYVEKIDFLTLSGVCQDGLQLNSLLQEENIDLLFLDIEMPYLNGLDLLGSLANPPKVILTTAYEKYAIKGYELNVVDYLLKPISFDRFLKSVNKVRGLIEVENLRKDEYVFVKSDNVLRKVNLEDILFIEAMENYVSIQLAKERIVTHITMKGILSSLGVGSFFQAHKSYIVNMNKIDMIDGNMIGIGSWRIPIARNMRETMMKMIMEKRV